jgi:hypothetical protein
MCRIRPILLAWGAVACLWAGTTVARAEEYPYTAYVVRERAEVLSGPSRRFYITHWLYFGDEVQVYKRDAAGWLGIRPPEDSFSWIPADTVEETDESGVFRVLVETPAWIGTPIESIQEHKYQVKLRPGELVEVVGERRLRTTEGDETWLKILPPAGEFRWIHLSQVSKTPPREQALIAAREARQPRTRRDTSSEIGTGIREERESSSVRNVSVDFPVQSAPYETVRSKLGSRPKSEIQLVDNKESTNQQPLRPRDPNLSPDGFVPRKPRKLATVAGVPAPSTELRMASREQMQNSIYAGDPISKTTESKPPSLAPVGAAASAAPMAPAQPRATTDSLPAFDSTKASDLLAKLDLELSLRVAQPRETWNLEPLRNQVQRIVDNGETPQERGQARLLLEKIRKFEETFQLPNDPLLATQPKGIPGTSPADPRFDGVGVLQPVLTRDGQKAVASYALVDSEGNPVAFVTPGPGLNLRRYENKPVGIYGKRGMIEALKKPHVLAERVIDLSVR